MFSLYDINGSFIGECSNIPDTFTGVVKYKGFYNYLCEEYYVNGKLHREDGPALITYNSDHYYLEGKLHRIGGPAIVYIDGCDHEYYLDGQQVTYQQYTVLTNSHNVG